MNSPGRTLLTWIGRCFLLAAPIIIVLGLYRPAPLSFLEPLACQDGLSMATDPNDPETPFDDRATCESETLLVDNTGRILAIGGISAVLALGAYTLRHRIRPRSLSAPSTPAHA